MQPKDFLVLDNGRPSQIISFQQFGARRNETAPDVEVIVVIDEIEVPANLVSYERTSVEAFLRQNGGKLPQPVSVFSLIQTGLWLIGRSSKDGNELAAKVADDGEASLIRANRGTKIGRVPASLGVTDPPSLEALKALGQIALTAKQESGRKLVFWVGPGWGLGSGTYAERTSSKGEIFYAVRWFSTLLREASLTLYSFSVGEKDGFTDLYKSSLKGLKSAHDASSMNLYRKVLAMQSGGRVLGPGSDLRSQMNSCLQEATIFYTLTLDPAHAELPDEYHELDVRVNKPGLTARTNSGYYDQPYYLDQPDTVTERVTIGQLEKVLEAAHGNRDADVAGKLSRLELTERLFGPQLLSLMAGLHGDKERRALTALADVSEFTSSSESENSTGPPDETEQQLMISRVAEYLKRTIPKLPNFAATRTTVEYRSTPPFAEGDTRVDYEPLHVASISKETVVYRDGQEIAQATTLSRKKAKDPDLVTYGTFGPALGFVHDAITVRGASTWSHWKEGEHGTDAVFDYKIPAESSLYQVWGCCLPDGDGTRHFEKHTAYHGEIEINPATGAVIRLVAIAETNGFLPVARSGIAVQYGPVEIGGKSYLCPVRSISIMRMRSVVTLREWDESFRTYGPYTTLMNDISYENYHVFRAESRVLPEYHPAND